MNYKITSIPNDKNAAGGIPRVDDVLASSVTNFITNLHIVYIECCTDKKSFKLNR